MIDETVGANSAAAEGADPDAPLVTEGVEGGADLAAENAALKDQLLRLAAEAENTRRRAEREANNARAFAIERFAKDLLGVADNLARALQHAPRDAGVNDFITGVELTEKALADAFERNGLKRLAPEPGDRFDPNVHQAMMEQPSDTVAAGAVVQLFQPGYELFGRVVRPAMVVVAAKGSGPKPGPGAYAGSADAAGSNLDTRA